MNDSMRKMIIKWNNKFPLDNWYRKKYNIPFNSQKHRDISQIDIYWEWLEESEFNKITYKELMLKEHEEDIKKGIYLKAQKNEEQLLKNEIDLFDALDVEKIQI